MLSAVIVDNEPTAIEDLQNTLTEFCPQVNLLATFRTMDEAIPGHSPKTA
jgi:hypothetical protein